MNTLFARMVNRLSHRPDSEHQQAIIRLRSRCGCR
jgi:hypothetical protein